MSDLIIQPTTKSLKTGAVLAAVVFLGLEIAYLALWTADVDHWVMILPVLIMLWPAVRWMKWRAVRIVVTGDRLRYESGMLSKDVRTIELSKLQYVKVHQGLIQRLFHVGDIGFETAGQGTWLPMHNVDNPQQIADELMNRARGSSVLPPPLRPGV